MVPFYKFAMKAGAAKTAVLTIYDEIGAWGVSAAGFRAGMDSVKDADEIDLEINSFGGDVFAGIAIYNMLKASGKKINAKVMGVAASAASLILMAGDTRSAPKNSMVMIHNPMAFAMGNSAEMRETADLLDKIGDGVRATYARATGLDDTALVEMLGKDTWMSADEALEHGFVTEVTEEIVATASFDLDSSTLPPAVRAIYASATAAANKDKTPEQIAAEANVQAAAAASAPAPAPVAEPAPVAAAPAPAAAAADPAAAEREAAQANLDLGMPVATATHALAMKAGLNDHADFLALAATTPEEGQAAVQRASEIVALAGYAKRPVAEVKALVRGGKTVAECRTTLMAAMAEDDVHTSTVKPAPTASAQNSSTQAKSPESAFAARAAARTARRKAN